MKKFVEIAKVTWRVLAELDEIKEELLVLLVFFLMAAWYWLVAERKFIRSSEELAEDYMCSSLSFLVQE